MIAMIAVGMVQVTVDQVVHMVAMGHRFVSTAGAVHMIGGMSAADMAGRARGGVRGVHLKDVLVLGRGMRAAHAPIIHKSMEYANMNRARWVWAATWW
jgi:hypothetical protein